MIVEVICTYCGHKFQKEVWSIKEINCEKCDDKNTKIKSIENNKIDYYTLEQPKKKLT